MKWKLYLVALLIVAIASWIRIVFFADLGRGTAYLTYYPAVVLAALYGGLRAGVLAAVVSALVVVYWIQTGNMPPVESMSMGVFLLSCTIISGIAEAMRRAQARAQLEKEKTAAAENSLKAALDEARALNRKLVEAQGQLLQSEKMASIGQLAAGVAHEINNPIGFVTSNLGSLENYLKDIFAITDAYARAEAAFGRDCQQLDEVRLLKQERDFDFLKADITALMAESREGLTRVAKIVRDLKDFSRPGETTMQHADLHQGLDSTLNIIWNELKYKCTVNKAYGELPPVWCVPSQLNQVFMNLLLNAADAIPDKGEINIRTGRQGGEVFVAIADSGIGIPAENLSRIFDPFFTTKPVGKGTGLGLSLVYSIVQKHGGHIAVESKPGQGSTFTVRLPVGPADENSAAIAVPPATTPAS